MSLQFNISPPVKNKKLLTEPIKVEKEETAIVVFAPFTPNAKVFFDGIKLGSTVSQTVILRNPASQEQEIFVTKQPPPERNLQICIGENILSPKSDTEIVLVWRPLSEGAWRDVICFESGRLKKDLFIICKSLAEKKCTKTVKKKNVSRVVSKKVKTPPKFCKNFQNKNSSVQYPKRNIKPNDIFYSNGIHNTNAKDKENYPIHNKQLANNSQFISPSKIDFNNIIQNNTPYERYTYTIKDNEFMKKISEQSFGNSIIEKNFNVNIKEEIIDQRDNFEVIAKFDGAPRIKLEEFNDSLEDSIEKPSIYLKDVSNMLQLSPAGVSRYHSNTSFDHHTPIQTYKDIRISLELNQDLCSTNKKSQESESTGKSVSQLSERFSTLNLEVPFMKEVRPRAEFKELNVLQLDNVKIENESYIKEKGDTFIKEINALGNMSSTTYTAENRDSFNVSTATYVKETGNLFVKDINALQNITTSTFTKETFPELKDTLKNNLSSENYDIHNASSSTRLGEDPQSYNFIAPKTYNDSLSGDEVRKVLEANLWCKDKPGLEFIVEEPQGASSGSGSDHGSPRKNLKRKSFLQPSYPSPSKKTCKGNWNRTKYRRSSILDRSINSSLLATPVKQKSRISSVIKDPFVIAATNSIDPFLQRDFYDQEWIEEQEKKFFNCLNLLLAPPEDVGSAKATPDVGKLWDESKNENVIIAPSNENFTRRFFLKGSLDSLRKLSLTLYRSEEIQCVLKKVTEIVDAGKLSIRKDKNLHVNVSLQTDIVKILFCYNPFWLQIGLEVVYGTYIKVHPKHPKMCLTNFLSEKFFKNAFLLRKYKTVQSEKYTLEIKKIMLKKFLYLVFFLDVAKTKKLIFFDPCLFSKKAAIKNSKEILLNFSKEVLFGIGDVTKYLEPLGYVLKHKQTYINEYEYRIENLGTDLRDGVRLARIVELILLRNDLVSNLRAPAISRLQKVFNVKVVFDALNESGLQIIGDIVPTDIVDGHRDKTLSLLWQIIYKFQGPRYIEASKTIQKWWRSLPIILKRNFLKRQRELFESAAVKVQRWYRRLKLANQIENQIIPLTKQIMEEKRLEIVANKIKSYLKMRVQRNKYLKLKQMVVNIQSNCRKFLVLREVQKRKRAAHLIQNYCKTLFLRNRYLQLRSAAINVQRRFRAKLAMKSARNEYQQIRAATKIIQERYRCFKAMKTTRENYLELKSKTIIIQRMFRAKRQMKIVKEDFQKLRIATVTIQNKYRALKEMKIQRQQFLETKNATTVIQRRYRAIKLMEIERKQYILLKNSCVIIQRRYRALKAMQRDRIDYQRTKNAVIFIQKRFRCCLLAKTIRNDYLELRNKTIIIQRLFRANRAMKTAQKNYTTIRNSVMIIQEKFRALMLMKNERKKYLLLKEATVFIQQKYRAQIAMKNDQKRYKELQKATVVIQRRYRSILKMRNTRKSYQKLRKNTLLVQRLFKAKLAMKRERCKYQLLRKSALVTQRRYRALKLMQIERTRYISLKNSCVIIQRHYRALKAMQRDRLNYQRTKNAAVVIQKRFKCWLLAKTIRNDYLELRNKTIIIQRLFRANRAMKTAQKNYKIIRNSVMIIQERFRAFILMKNERKKCLVLQKATIFIQQKYRAQIAMKSDRKKFKELQKATNVIQRRYRSILKMRNIRKSYLQLREKTLLVQRLFKAKLAMRTERNKYQVLRKSALVIQRRYRALKLMQIERTRYISLKNSCVIIQRHYRALKAMQRDRMDYQRTKNAVVIIQRRFRCCLLAKTIRNDYLELRNKTIFIQRLFRANRAMKTAQKNYKIIRNSVMIIQERLRAFILMQNERKKYILLKKATVLIQKKYRAQIAMKNDRKRFKEIQKATVVIQRRYRSILKMRNTRCSYLLLRQKTIFVQRLFKAKLAMKTERNKYQVLQKSALVFQRRYRALKLMKIERKKFISLKNSCIIIQRRYKALKAMQNERMEYQRTKNAVVFIQRRFRCGVLAKTIRNDYLELRNKTLFIQRLFRANRDMKTVQKNYTIIRNSVMIIQKRLRAFTLMKNDRKNYLLLKKVTVFIQRKYRGKLLTKKAQMKFQTLKKSSIIIQRRYRSLVFMKKTRRNYLQLKENCIFIQRIFRANLVMKRVRASYQMQQKSAIIIQRRYRAFISMRIARNDYLKLRMSVITIQRYFRAKKLMLEAKKKFQELKTAVLYVQNMYRAKKLMNCERQKYLMTKNSVVNLQKYVRGYLVRAKFKEELLIRKIEKVKIVRKNTAAAKIQAFWKGYRERKRNSTEIKQIQERLKTANTNAQPENTLGYKMHQGLKLLEQGRPTTVGHLTRVLADLDYLTRRCRVSCLKLSQILPEYLYKIITTAIRSLPDMNASVFATSILLNFYRYPPSKEPCWMPQYMERVMMVMMHWIDKEEALFPHLCTLVWLFAQNEEYRKFIVAIPNVVNILTRMKKLCYRKQKMLARADLKRMSLFMPQPSTTPDWGLDYATRPRIFSNSVHAFECFIHELGLQID